MKSFLFICLGLTITTLVFAGARSTIVRPDPPGKPSARDVTVNKCIIEFLAPRYDGGAPIMCYIIEYQDTDVFSKWIDVGTSDSLEYAVTDMKEGSTVTFRVTARNKCGPSQPSKESDEVTFEDPF